MANENTSWRTAPPALLVGFGLVIVWSVVRLVISLQGSVDTLLSPRVWLIGEGIGYAHLILVLVGTRELRDRCTRATRTRLQLAVAAATIWLLVDVCRVVLDVVIATVEPRWVWELYSYVGSVAALLFAVAIMLALPASRRWVGITAVIVVFVSWPPPFLREPLFGWLDLGRAESVMFHGAVWIMSSIALLAAVCSVPRAATTPDPGAAGSGFRLAAKSLWLRVIAAVCVVLLTLMLASSGAKDGIEIMRLARLGQGVLAVVALVMLAVAALRTARAALPELSALTLVVSATASLWAAGVSFVQLGYLYRFLDNTHSATLYFGRANDDDWLEALNVATPVVVIFGVGLLATVLAGYAARHGDNELREEAQGKGIGYVALMLVAVAIHAWMVPKAVKAHSMGIYVALSLLGAASSIYGTVLIARLLGRGAEAFERQPGLPGAKLVSDSSR